MKYYDLDPFLTIQEGRVTLDFTYDREDVIHVYVNNVLAFNGRLRELIYRIYITGEKTCELNFKRTLKLHQDGNALYERVYKLLQIKRKEKNYEESI